LNTLEIYPNKINPNAMNSSQIERLKLSIKGIGVLQPIIVREKENGEGGKYEIIDGEHRWQACKELCLNTIPAMIRVVSDSEMAQIIMITQVKGKHNSLKGASVAKTVKDECDKRGVSIKGFGLTPMDLDRRIGYTGFSKGEVVSKKHSGEVAFKREQDSPSCKKVEEHYCTLLIPLKKEEFEKVALYLDKFDKEWSVAIMKVIEGGQNVNS
jgi:ParB-like chromosome segregation protein Spo0J